MQQYTTQHSLNNLVICMKNVYLWLAIKLEIEFQVGLHLPEIVTQSKLFERFIYKLVRQNFLETKSYVGTTYNLQN